MSQHAIPVFICNDDSRREAFAQAFQKLSQGEIETWLESQGASLQRKEYTEQALRASQNSDTRSASFIAIGCQLDTIAPLDELLERCNALLAPGGMLCCVAVPAAVKREQLLKRHPWGIRSLAMAMHYLWHHVASKLWISRGIYRLSTGNRHRSMSRVEILGRLRHAGFAVTFQHIHDNALTLCAERDGDPIGEPPHLGAIIGLPRIGKGGRTLHIYKIRTMHAYSEFLQDDMYARHRLTRKGKIIRDYRVTLIGHWLRSHWLDEWPMIFNLLRGDIKLVGVRPISKSFFQRYSTEAQQLHISVKPGLMPPLYAYPVDADSMDAIQENERQYIEAYRKQPFRTDWCYFWRIVGNIVFRRRRSE